MISSAISRESINFSIWIIHTRNVHYSCVWCGSTVWVVPTTKPHTHYHNQHTGKTVYFLHSSIISTKNARENKRYQFLFLKWLLYSSYCRDFTWFSVQTAQRSVCMKWRVRLDNVNNRKEANKMVHLKERQRERKTVIDNQIHISQRIHRPYLKKVFRFID